MLSNPFIDSDSSQTTAAHFHLLQSIDDEVYDSDEYPELSPNLSALVHHVSKQTGKAIASCQKGRRGTYHEIYFLTSSDGSKLVARLCRSVRDPASLRSEVATMNLVRSHTSIPVPAVHLVMDAPSNDVGAQYLVMDYIEAVHLYRLWNGLTLEHKKGVLSQIVDVLSQLAGLHFDKIGSIFEDGAVGPLIVDDKEVIKTVSAGPFSSTWDYLQLFADQLLSSHQDISERARASIPAARDSLRSYLDSHAKRSDIRPPFRLLHPDLDAQNLLFTNPEPSSQDTCPRLVGVIDWEYAHTGPLYFLYEYPIFIQDVDWSKHLYQENAILRRHFARALREKHPTGSREYEEARACIPSGKCSALNGFAALFMQGHIWSGDMMLSSVDAYAQKRERARHIWEGLTGRPTQMSDYIR